MTFRSSSGDEVLPDQNRPRKSPILAAYSGPEENSGGQASLKANGVWCQLRNVASPIGDRERSAKSSTPRAAI